MFHSVDNDGNIEYLKYVALLAAFAIITRTDAENDNRQVLISPGAH